MDFEGDDNKWVQNLKVGDKVIYTPGGIHNTRRVSKVTRLTKTLLIVNGEKFNRVTGWETGSGYRKAYIDEATPKLILTVNREVRLKNWEYDYRAFDFGKASDDAKWAIIKIIQKENERIKNA